MSGKCLLVACGLWLCALFRNDVKITQILTMLYHCNISIKGGSIKINWAVQCLAHIYGHLCPRNSHKLCACVRALFLPCVLAFFWASRHSSLRCDRICFRSHLVFCLHQSAVRMCPIWPNPSVHKWMMPSDKCDSNTSNEPNIPSGTSTHESTHAMHNGNSLKPVNI